MTDQQEEQSYVFDNETLQKEIHDSVQEVLNSKKESKESAQIDTTSILFSVVSSSCSLLLVVILIVIIYFVLRK